MKLKFSFYSTVFGSLIDRADEPPRPKTREPKWSKKGPLFLARDFYPMLRHGIIWDSYQLDGVDVVALEPLPDADFRICFAAAEADDVAGRVGEGGDLAVVRQDGVGARARQQVPHADHPVLFKVAKCVLVEVL